MARIFLIPVNESVTALRPILWVAQNLQIWHEEPIIHLLNVQPSLPRDIGRFINADTIRDFHLDTGMQVLSKPRDQLIVAGLLPTLHVVVGEAAPAICHYAESHGCSQILLGTRGHSGMLGTLLGSVTTKVAHLSTVPVLLIR